MIEGGGCGSTIISEIMKMGGITKGRQTLWREGKVKNGKENVSINNNVEKT